MEHNPHSNYGIYYSACILCCRKGLLCIHILIALPDPKTRIGIRNRVILSVMYSSGARAQEICDLRVRDICFSDDRAILHIVGKGRKSRQVQM